jgi:glutamate-ammonia-ligase adenylyltransferase
MSPVPSAEHRASPFAVAPQIDTSDEPAVRRGEERWREKAAETADPTIVRFADAALADRAIGDLLRTIFAHSPFLTQEATGNIAFFREIVDDGLDDGFDRLLASLRALPVERMTTSDVMRELRRAKRRAALLIALADIGGAWSLEPITGALSRIADSCLDRAVGHLVAAPGAAEPSHDRTGAGDGLIVLGMGKLGARELNYSSDIDLVIFYDDTRFSGSTLDNARTRFVRLARALVRMMEERTGDGYVFRTDLRLRPDPAATPLAVSLSAAEVYYGSLGQNWERAAMIKARQVAGDPEAGDRLFNFLRPWIWRRNLDFAAIDDIHAIKRQINRHKIGPAQAGFLDYNVKLGHGGIREIEFFAQTQQLIFGGREASLRAPGTCDALDALCRAGRIEAAVASDLSQAYRFLRLVEHRLQMVDDQQTHSLPRTDEGMARISRFLGFAHPALFMETLRLHVERVQAQFAALFERSPSLSGPGDLVFTGVEDDPETLETLRALGYVNVTSIAAAIRGWHHGRYRAVRSERAREILTKLIPALLEALAKTAEPDAAFFHFDAFLGALPAGVMFLSLLAENAHLLGLVGRIMGMAPQLSEQLGKTPALFDELLTADFFATLPDIPSLSADLDRALAQSRGYEDALVRLRRWAAGKKFQAGVHILEGVSDGVAAGRFLAAVAEVAIMRLAPLVEAEFASKHGPMPGGGLVVIAFGRLGGRLMSFTSDLDVVTVYDAPEGVVSAGDRKLEAPVYFTRLTQRLIAAISAPMAEGRLYEVDLRLRPSGEAGPAAAAFPAFSRYHGESAWTWEHMALTRARVVSGPARLTAAVEATIRATLTHERDPARLVADVAAMRLRIAEEHKPASRWDFKYVPGGLVDIEFAVEYLVLREAHRHPHLLTTETAEQIERLAAAGILSRGAADDLTRALYLAWRVQGLIRLTTRGTFDPATAPAAIRARLCREVGDETLGEGHPEIDFAQAETILDSILAASRTRYEEIVRPAIAAGGTPETATRI